MKKILISLLALLMLAANSDAQTPGTRPAPPKMKDPAEMAKEKADRMQEEVSLDKKQYKKVYKLFKKDFEYRRQAMQNSMPGGPGMGGGFGGGMPGGPGMGGGMPPQGGGPDMGGGFGGGMPGGPGMGGGMPPQGGMQPGERPEGGPGMGPGGDIITDEYLEKQDAKLRKILSSEQYDKWTAKHPSEHLELPPMELK